MTFESRKLLHSIERILPPVMLAGLLAIQITHLYVEGVRAKVPLYSGIYTVPKVEGAFLPSVDEMKHLAIRLGREQGLPLNAENVDVGLILDVLRLTIRVEGRGDWEKFFVAYDENLRRAAVSRCERARPAHPNVCAFISEMPFQGWSASRGSWIKPLDLASVTVLAVALVLWLAGRRLSGVP